MDSTKVKAMDDIGIWKIVLIDDETDIREVLTIALEDAGYQVASAADGRAGLDMCESFQPQIVITDIRMPRMDGIKVLESLKANTPDVEVIVATAFGEMDLAIRALQLDASDFITKPINDEALHLALKRARERYSSRKQLADYTALLEKEKAATYQELVKTVSFNRNLIESSMDGILGCDNEGRVLTSNRAVETLLGISKADALNNMTVSQFFQPDQWTKFQNNLTSERFGGPGKIFLYETELRNADNESIPVQVSAAEIKENSITAGLVLFISDLREIRRLEREMADQAKILHQDKMMSLGRLAASVVHEINNPLAGILNYVRLMIRVMDRGAPQGEQLEKFQRYLNLVESETGRCSQIVSSLLAFSRRSEPTFAPTNVKELLARCVLLSRHKMETQNIHLVVNAPPGIPAIIGDHNQLQQCIINLIFNAIDAMPDGGTLTLTAEYKPGNDHLKIIVSDTGNGIAPNDLPHIFEPFFTTKKEGYGVGLGLSTAFGIIDRHHGKIEVKSLPGKGAVFQIHLPLAS
jgi:two-component system NtrC family sensor kinase